MVEVGAKIDTKNLEVGAYRMAAAAEFTAKAVSVTVKCRINVNIGRTESPTPVPTTGCAGRPWCLSQQEGKTWTKFARP
jgi:hypothetical protein